MTPDQIKRTGLAAIECFNDPARRDHYFETLYDDDIVLRLHAGTAHAQRDREGLLPGVLRGVP